MTDTQNHIKVRRRLSDARWRANVASCYETLKHIIPVNKRASRRQISKAVILSETSKHIKFLEEILETLLTEEGKLSYERDSVQWAKNRTDDIKRDFIIKQIEKMEQMKNEKTYKRNKPNTNVSENMTKQNRSNPSHSRTTTQQSKTQDEISRSNATCPKGKRIGKQIHEVIEIDTKPRRKNYFTKRRAEIDNKENCAETNVGSNSQLRLVTMKNILTCENEFIVSGDGKHLNEAEKWKQNRTENQIEEDDWVNYQDILPHMEADIEDLEVPTILDTEFNDMLMKYTSEVDQKQEFCKANETIKIEDSQFVPKGAIYPKEEVLVDGCAPLPQEVPPTPDRKTKVGSFTPVKLPSRLPSPNLNEEWESPTPSLMCTEAMWMSDDDLDENVRNETTPNSSSQKSHTELKDHISHRKRRRKRKRCDSMASDISCMSDVKQQIKGHPSQDLPKVVTVKRCRRSLDKFYPALKTDYDPSMNSCIKGIDFSPTIDASLAKAIKTEPVDHNDINELEPSDLKNMLTESDNTLGFSFNEQLDLQMNSYSTTPTEDFDGYLVYYKNMSNHLDNAVPQIREQYGGHTIYRNWASLQQHERDNFVRQSYVTEMGGSQYDWVNGYPENTLQNTTPQQSYVQDDGRVHDGRVPAIRIKKEDPYGSPCIVPIHNSN